MRFANKFDFILLRMFIMATERSRFSTTIPVFCTCPFIVTTMEISFPARVARLNAVPLRVQATMSTSHGQEV